MAEWRWGQRASANQQQPDAPRVRPSHRVIVTPTSPPQGGQQDPRFVLDFYAPFCAPAFGGCCGGVRGGGAALLYRLAPGFGSEASSWQIETVWAARDGDGFGAGIAADEAASALASIL